MLRGRILAESLRPGAVLAVPDLRVLRMWREDVSASAAPDQPPVWTLLDVEAPDERAGELADALAAALLAEGGWYASWSSPGGRSGTGAGTSPRGRTSSRTGGASGCRSTSSTGKVEPIGPEAYIG
jgi:hypothetical protein